MFCLASAVRTKLVVAAQLVSDWQLGIATLPLPCPIKAATYRDCEENSDRDEDCHTPCHVGLLPSVPSMIRHTLTKGSWPWSLDRTGGLSGKTAQRHERMFRSRRHCRGPPQSRTQETTCSGGVSLPAATWGVTQSTPGGAKNSRAMPSGSRKETPEP